MYNRGLQFFWKAQITTQKTAGSLSVFKYQNQWFFDFDCFLKNTWDSQFFTLFFFLNTQKNNDSFDLFIFS
jgi:hypothetical protein